MKRSMDVEYVEFNKYIWNRLGQEEKNWIIEWCDMKLKEYFDRI